MATLNITVNAKDAISTIEVLDKKMTELAAKATILVASLDSIGKKTGVGGFVKAMDDVVEANERGRKSFEGMVKARTESKNIDDGSPFGCGR